MVGPVAFLIPGAPDTGEAGRRTAVAASPSAPFPDPTLKGGRPDGEVAVGRDRDPVPKGPPSPATRIPERGPGTFEVAAAAPLGSQEGVTYRVEVERGLPFSTVDVARLVEATLADQRGWATRHTLVRVDGHADLRIVLATPQTADELCAPLDTGGRLSCRNGDDVWVSSDYMRGLAGTQFDKPSQGMSVSPRAEGVRLLPAQHPRAVQATAGA